MALSDIELAKLEVDFCAGKLSRLKIAQKHNISRNTLKKYAQEKDWVYGSKSQELTSLIRDKTYQRLIDDTVDLSTEITKNFLCDIDKYRALSLMPAKELMDAYKEADETTKKEGKKARVPKEEFTRIWESAKAIKTAIEGISHVYADQRKALGLDIEADVEKARRVKKAEEPTERHDPTENLDEETIDKLIEDIEKEENGE